MHTVLLTDVTVCYAVERSKMEVVEAMEAIRRIEILCIFWGFCLALQRVLGVVKFVQSLPMRLDGIAVATIGRVVFDPPETSVSG